MSITGAGRTGDGGLPAGGRAAPGRYAQSARWLNRNVAGMGVASLFSDLGHEMATAVLPLFLRTLGASAAALGVIEGVSDGAAMLARLAGGRLADRPGLRHVAASVGYAVTGLATGAFAFASSWTWLLGARAVGWASRGVRGPCRDNMLVESVPRAQLGKAFGFHRAMDTVGALAGPLGAALLLGRLGFRGVFALSLFPGLLSGAAFFFLVWEPDGVAIAVRRAAPRWGAALTPEFRRFLAAASLFGIGDFAHSMLVMRAVELLRPGAKSATIAILLYALHNGAHALAAYPIGALGDRWPRRRLLALWYFVGAVTAAGFAWGPPALAALALLFVLGGTVMAAQETLEAAVAADLLPAEVRGTGLGLLGAANGLGDFVSSVGLGLLWARFSAPLAFGISAVLGAGAGFVLLRAPLAGGLERVGAEPADARGGRVDR